MVNDRDLLGTFSVIAGRHNSDIAMRLAACGVGVYWYATQIPAHTVAKQDADLLAAMMVCQRLQALIKLLGAAATTTNASAWTCMRKHAHDMLYKAESSISTGAKNHTLFVPSERNVAKLVQTLAKHCAVDRTLHDALCACYPSSVPLLTEA